MAHLKTFATWMHSLQPFPLGHPMAKIKLPAIGSSLHIERALTPAERRRLLMLPINCSSAGAVPRIVNGTERESGQCERLPALPQPGHHLYVD